MSDKIRQTIGLSLALLPGALFILGVLHLRHAQLASWWMDRSLIPWQFWVIAVTGSVALFAAVGDWYFHAYTAKGKVSAIEEQGEILALGGGSLLFLLMAGASVSRNPVP